jgi:3-dehydroquinate dehydratase/shikimate dehydrogenase
MVNDLNAFMRRMVLVETREIDLNFRGFAVTMPHKQAIIKYLDAIDPTAASIGAVNTIKIDQGGKLIGYNTDAHGFIEPLKQRFGDLKNARVAVLGSGGAARACVFALKNEGCDVTALARDGEKAKGLAMEFDVRSSALTELTSSDFDIVVNATPVGMTGASENVSLLNAAQLKGVKFVYDLVTAPTDTPLVREANIAGVPAIGGLEMLIAQAAKQFEIWTGQTADVELMRISAFKHLR